MKALRILCLIMLLCLLTAPALAGNGSLYRGISNHHDEVEFLQYQLFYAGYLGDDISEVDGIFGKKTEDAVKAFQRDHELAVTGVVDQATQIALDEDWENNMEPQGDWDPYPYCYVEYYENDLQQIVPCSKHAAIYGQAAQALDASQTNGIHIISVLKSNLQMWQTSLDEQYQLMIDLSQDAFRPLWQNHKTTFANYHAAQTALWSAQYGTDSIEALELGCIMLADQCVDLCCRLGSSH